MNVVSSEKRKDLILKSNYLRESETSITNMNDDDALEARTFNNTLEKRLKVYLKKVTVYFILLKVLKKKVAAYISDGPSSR